MFANTKKETNKHQVEGRYDPSLGVRYVHGSLTLYHPIAIAKESHPKERLQEESQVHADRKQRRKKVIGNSITQVQKERIEKWMVCPVGH